MEQSFNFKRALLVFKSIFICYKRFFKPTLFVYVGIITVLCIVDIVISRNGVLVFNVAPIGFPLISLVVLGIFPIAMYFQYYDKLYIATSYMLPASVKEKFFVPLFVISILTPALLYGIYVILISLFGGISELTSDNTGVYRDAIFSAIVLNNKEYLPLLQGAMLTQSICGLSLMLFGKLWVLPFIVLTLAPSRIHKMLNNFDMELFLYNENAQIFVLIVIPLLFWTISYLKFRKLQIKK